jgi:sigma-B regulation protein RsbU (phosphoserine phosphatase)
MPQPLLDEQSIVLQPGSMLLLYTDGVTEATDPHGEFFGIEQLDQTVHDQHFSSAQALCDDLVNVLIRYHQDTPQADDITVLGVLSA